MQNDVVSALRWVGVCAVLAIAIGRLDVGGGSGGSGSASREGLRIEEQPKRIVLRWNGTVDQPMVRQLEDAYQRLADEKRDILISLNSPGGSVLQGGKAIQLIRKMQRTHTVDTIVEETSICASMCVPIFLAGTRRSADRKARFMFHEVRFARSDPNEEELRRQLRAMGIFKQSDMRRLISSVTDLFYEQYLEANGVHREWLSEMRNEIRGRDVWRTAEQLMANRSGVVDELERR